MYGLSFLKVSRKQLYFFSPFFFFSKGSIVAPEVAVPSVDPMDVVVQCDLFHHGRKRFRLVSGTDPDTGVTAARSAPSIVVVDLSTRCQEISQHLMDHLISIGLIRSLRESHCKRCLASNFLNCFMMIPNDWFQ